LNQLDAKTTPRFWPQAWRFGLVGVGVTGLHVVIAVALIEAWSVAPVRANAIAFICATIASYVVNTLWSFRDRLHPQSFARFAAISVSGFGATVGLSGAADAMGAHYLVGLAAVVAVVPTLSFILHRTWTYRK
jgi:putative flippase GtrA